VFYCHFPDKLLAARKTWIKKLYRLPLDLAEELTTGSCNDLQRHTHTHSIV